MAEQSKILILDANVLIDYQQSDISVLASVHKHVARICIPTLIIEEVEGLSVNECERLGLQVIEPELSQLTRAVARRGRLSFHDHLCLIVASDMGITCVTNDRALRSACETEGVNVLWGLQLMTTLVQAAAMNADEAIRIAEKIHSNNPLHIPRDLVERFAAILRSAEANRRPD